MVVFAIPKSDATPHMANAKGSYQRRYYRRTADSTLPMEHYELQDMFGRRPHPLIDIRAKAVLKNITVTKASGSATLWVSFYFCNIGRAVLKHACLTFSPMESLWKHSGAAHSSPFLKTNAPVDRDLRVVSERGIIYPEDTTKAVRFEFGISWPPSRPDLEILYWAIGEDCSPEEGSCVVLWSSIIDRFEANMGLPEIGIPCEVRGLA